MQNESFSSCVLLPEELQAGAHHFNRRAAQVRRKMCWQNCRMNCIIAFVILGILAVITIIVLGQHAYFNFVFEKKRSLIPDSVVYSIHMSQLQNCCCVRQFLCYLWYHCNNIKYDYDYDLKKTKKLYF